MNYARSVVPAVIVVVLVLSLVSCAKPEPVETTVFVEGMHCQGCSDAITKAVTALDGVSEVTADFETGVTIVIRDPKAVDNQTLKSTIEDLGYTVTKISD